MDKPEQPNCKTCGDTGRISKEINNGISFENCPDCPEQPNTELMIIKTIQGLIGVINHNLGKLFTLTPTETTECKVLISQALENIDLFQRTTLNELQKAFE